MSLIIKDKIPMLKVGYPTVSDKYNVSGAVLAGTAPVKFGQLVKFSNTKGYFEAITSAVTLDQIAGFVLATNVKLVETYAGDEVLTQPGEAFNLLVNGFMAVELDAGATVAQITAKAPVAVILASGKLTTKDKVAANTIVELPNVIFTGTYENHGTSASPKYVAEVYVK